LDFNELKNSSYILIRHGMSEANFVQKMAMKKFGSDSKEHHEACLDNAYQDPSLHPIGLAMCDHS
jgi:hypothetical protein